MSALRNRFCAKHRCGNRIHFIGQHKIKLGNVVGNVDGNRLDCAVIHFCGTVKFAHSAKSYTKLLCANSAIFSFYGNFKNIKFSAFTGHSYRTAKYTGVGIIVAHHKICHCNKNFVRNIFKTFRHINSKVNGTKVICFCIDSNINIKFFAGAYLCFISSYAHRAICPCRRKNSNRYHIQYQKYTKEKRTNLFKHVVITSLSKLCYKLLIQELQICKVYIIQLVSVRHSKSISGK